MKIACLSIVIEAANFAGNFKKVYLKGLISQLLKNDLNNDKLCGRIPELWFCSIFSYIQNKL
ncbi:MAG: hypothetical protein DYG83_07695 [Candidatus Brocadia sp. AMX2]|jgi:hypothetical protein|nr:MAG: hypothetical protein EDM70_04845 [Candidatus Brocadia sp. AMX2]MBC6931461.1 hypothetical protein [Candidatus Brocadia sp.]MBL1169152.1 hypothetical protein [Candidatus Brocadia sp. AMX1]MCE7866699.1 hypothetical protein [Candidatus Brocadia sp. AMX2]MCQ3916570.1 hypothetical protein [Candidatus Brocadia sp.]